MGLFKIIRYRKYRRRRNKLKADIKAVALQESVAALMKDRKFLPAMRQIKELWTLKTSPWTYSTSILNFIECLVWKRRFRDIGLLEKELLHFYIAVLDISPRRVMSSADDVMAISAGSRSVHASLLSFYAAILAQRKLEKKPAMRLAQESVAFIKKVIDSLNGDEIVKQYLLALMRELRDYINATRTKRKIKLKTGYLDKCDRIINEVKNDLKRENEEPKPAKTDTKSRRSKTSSTKIKTQKSIHQVQKLSVDSVSQCEATAGSSSRQRLTTVASAPISDGETRDSAVASDILELQSGRSLSKTPSGSSRVSTNQRETSARKGVTRRKRDKEATRPKTPSTAPASESHTKNSSPVEELQSLTTFRRNERRRVSDSTSSGCEVRTVSSTSYRGSSHTPP